MEVKLISSLLTNNDNIKYFYGKVTPDMIYRPICKDAYEIFLKGYDLGNKTNVVDLSKYLQSEANTQNEIAAFLQECLAVETPLANELKSIANALISRYKAAELKKTCDTLSFLPKDIDATIRKLNTVTETMLKEEKPKGKALTDIASQYKDYFFNEHPQGIRTGIYGLDEILNGLHKGDVTILGARPAVGKSALATQILCDVAEKGFRVGYFNLEMTDQQILERVIARYSGIGLMRIKKAISFCNDEQKLYTKAIERIENNKGLYVFSGNYTPGEIRVLCKNQKFDLIVIDYLQLLKPDKESNNRVTDVGAISKGVKAIAMELEVPVIALSQLNRHKGATDEPNITDLRESGDIEQDASVVLMMWNIDEAGTVKGLKVEKNRQGELGKLALKFEGAKMNFDTMPYKTFDQVEKEFKNSKPTNNLDDCPFG